MRPFAAALALFLALTACAAPEDAAVPVSDAWRAPRGPDGVHPDLKRHLAGAQ